MLKTFKPQSWMKICSHVTFLPLFVHANGFWSVQWSYGCCSTYIFSDSVTCRWAHIYNWSFSFSKWKMAGQIRYSTTSFSAGLPDNCDCFIHSPLVTSWSSLETFLSSFLLKWHLVPSTLHLVCVWAVEQNYIFSPNSDYYPASSLLF